MQRDNHSQGLDIAKILAITLIKCQLYSFLSGQAWEGGFNEKMLRAAISN